MGEIPQLNFRLEHGFAAKPDLVTDTGLNGSILAGQVSSSDSVSAILLGKLAETPYRNVWLDVRGAHVLYVMGKRRSGKSYTLGVLAEGLAAESWIRQGGTLRQGILVLDTMNVFLTMPFPSLETLPETDREIQELRKWKMGTERLPIHLYHPAGASLPAGVTSREITLRPSDLTSDEWCGLFEADPFADPLGHLVTEVHGKVALDGYTDSRNGNPVAPAPQFGFEDLLNALEYDGDLQRYHRDTREALRRRFHAIRRLPLFSTHGFNIRELIRPGEISVILLRDLDQQLRATLVALIVAKTMQLRGISEHEERMQAIHLARAARASTGTVEAAQEVRLAEECAQRAAAGLPRAWIIIDEAHNYAPASGVTPSRRPLKKYVDEGRNLGLSIVVATQNPSGLDPSLQRNADILIVHALSRQDDIDAAAGMINTTLPTEVVIDTRQKFEGMKAFESLVRSLPLGYALVATDRANRLFPVRVRPRVTVHGGTGY